MSRSYCGLRFRNWAAVLAVLLLAGGVSVMMGERQPVAAQLPAPPSKEGGANYAKSLSKAFRDVARKTLPSVVMIRHIGATPEQEAGDDESAQEPFGMLPPNLPPELRRFFGEGPSMPHRRFGEEISTGSGVIIDPAGIILTNNHVVAGGGKIRVRLHDGREFDAADVKLDPKSDLAIVRIKGADKLEAAKLGNSDEMQVGDWVLALGDPFGLEGTVTAGIISATGRSGLNITQGVRENFIQTDAAINPGNSGGPLVNLDGEVIAINESIASLTGGYQGVGFCIPSNLAKWVSQQLIATGKVQRSYLGVRLKPVTSELPVRFNVPEAEGKGAVVDSVMPKSPAAEAGLKTGDVIVEFAGKPIESMSELQQVVEETPVGQRKSLTVLREGNRVTLPVTTAEQPANYKVAMMESLAPGKGDSVQDEKLGLEVADLTADVARKLGVKQGEGVVITDVKPGSPAATFGLASGMVIVEVNKKPVKSADDFRAALGDQPLEKGVLMRVRTPQGTRFIVIQSS